MATRYAVANGNWSSTATWDGGTLPTSSDDVYANNKTVTLDQDVTVVSLRNATVASPAITAGGSFNAPTSGTRTVNANVISAANGSVVVIPAGTVTFTLNGNITAGTNANSTFTIGTFTYVDGNLSSYPTVNINGNITAGSVTSSEGVRHGGGRLYIAGTVTGGSGGTNSYGVSVSNSNNIPSYTEIKGWSSLVGGTSTSGSTAALAVSPTLTGTSITPSSTVINCSLTGGASGSGGSGNAAYNHLTASIPCTITGNITGSLANRAINISGGADLTVNGHVYAASTGAGGSQSEAAIVHNGPGQLTINGNLYGSTFAGGVQSGCVYLQGTGAKYTQTGDIVSGNSTSNNFCLWSGNSGQTIIVNGNVTGGVSGSNSSVGVRSNNTSAITFNGNVTGGAGTSASGVNIDTTGTVTINGTVTGGTGSLAHGVNLNSTGVVVATKLKGNDGGPGSVGINGSGYAVNSSNVSAIIRFKQLEFGALGNTPISGLGSYQIVDDAANNTTKFYTSAASTKTLVDGNASGLMPAVTNVRSGISYNGGSLTGTLAVPSASSVAVGVAVDNTVGTAVLTQANVWSYALSSASATSGSVGEKLKKVANTSDIIALG